VEFNPETRYDHRMRIARLALVGALSAAGASQDQPVVEWIRANAIPLAGVEAGHGFADLQPLKKLIGDARIVSLGEATHGSREIFQLKHRMVEFLATEMGFNVFAIEANMPEAYRMNDYVLNGTGDPAELLKGMYFWTWDTGEVLELIQWMRDFNRSGKGRIEFTGFDMQTPTVALDLARRFVADRDADFLAKFDVAAGMVSPEGSASSGSPFGVATGTFPVADAAGKKIRFRGYIKTEGVASGWAGLWWRVDGAEGAAPLAFDNMEDRGATGTSGWKRYAIKLTVDPNAKGIQFGLIMPGRGTAWFDDLAIEVDGRRYKNASLFDLGFESSSPQGFSTDGSGYDVRLDAEVAHSGKQSLRMTRVADLPDPAHPDQSLVESRWKDVIGHLEGGRAVYRAGGATDGDIDWAIQNARIVFQGAQWASDKVPRDRSMAENIKWIADHNPNARIVLWAHNGHVAKGSFGYETMGGDLRGMFGQEMFVFGSAFNSGSFQAFSASRRTLKTFTVPPAPPGSLDATLASSGIPMFALDLRQAPAWFRKPRESRQIGAVYPENAPFAHLAKIVAPEAYDGILFIDQTTAARKNPGL